MSTVSFTEMKSGTKEDYELLASYEQTFASQLPTRMIAFLCSLEEALEGYPVSRLTHSLQCATRAHRDGASEEMVVAALLHDIGDGLATHNHSQFAAAVLRPYVSDEIYWIIKHHGLFQEYYYGHHYGRDRNARERYADHPHYQATVDFCERWDQSSFDPDYDTLPLEYFEPMVHRVLGGEPRFPAS